MVHNKNWVPGAVRLSWQVDRAGYEAMKLGEFHRLRRASEPRRQDVPAPKIFPFWPLTGRKRSPKTFLEEAVDDDEIVIARIGGSERSYEVGLSEADIFLEIAKKRPETAERAKEFAAQWGLLTAGDYTPLTEFALMGQRLCDLLEGKRRFKALAANNEGLRLGIADIRISRIRSKEAPEVFWYVRDLRSFCWLEYLSAVGGAVDIRRCPRCGEFFRRQHVKGPSGSYCSNACRQAAWRERSQATRRRSVTSK